MVNEKKKAVDLAKKRSAAAYKAWETRRKKAKEARAKKPMHWGRITEE